MLRRVRERRHPRLEFDGLFPPRSETHRQGERRPFIATDVLACIGTEALIVATAAANLRQSVQLSDADHERLMLAAERLQTAVRLANGER
jgi:hypothetical protein